MKLATAALRLRSPYLMILRFLDVGGLQPATDSWEATYFVFYAVGRVGVIERQTETGYYRFTPDGPAESHSSLGDFDIDVLKRRVAEWLMPGLLPRKYP